MSLAHSTSSTGADAVITITPATDAAVSLQDISWSYTHITTSGRLTVKFDSSVVYDVDVEKAGFDFLFFNHPADQNAVVEIRLFGVAAAVAKLNARYTA